MLTAGELEVFERIADALEDIASTLNNANEDE